MMKMKAEEKKKNKRDVDILYCMQMVSPRIKWIARWVVCAHARLARAQIIEGSARLKPAFRLDHNPRRKLHADPVKQVPITPAFGPQTNKKLTYNKKQKLKLKQKFLKKTIETNEA